MPRSEDMPAPAPRRLPLPRPLHHLLRLLSVLLVARLAADAQASPTSDAEPAPGIGERVAELSAVRAQERLEAAESGWIALPAVFYAPETSVVFAAAALYYIPTRDGDGAPRVSQLGGAVAYTLKNQAFVEVRPDFFIGDDHLRGEYHYSYFPDQFFGLGNDTRARDAEGYISHIGRIRTYYERRITDRFFLGLLHELELYHVVERADGGLLETENVEGARGARASGLGLMLTHDSRDNVLESHRGGFYQINFTVFDPIVGSAGHYTRVVLDARQFLPLWLEHTLALRGYAELQSGRPPFQLMPALGGVSYARGYFAGRFRDRDALLLQVEYRAPLVWGFLLVGFASAGQVSRDPSALGFSRFHYAGGGGLRYLLDPDAGAGLRFDVGVGEDSYGIYFSINEAF